MKNLNRRANVLEAVTVLAKRGTISEERFEDHWEVDEQPSSTTEVQLEKLADSLRD